MATATYRDRWIECGTDEIRIRGYYFPWGTKRIRYADIRAVHRVPIGTLTGRYRVWGTSRPGYWASLDPARPSKTAALILDVGGRVKPFVTPDDPDAMGAAILAHTRLGRIDEGPGRLV
jgi:hypothetical protein